MPKSKEELQASKAGETAETNGFGSKERPWRPAGLYELHDVDGNLVASVFLKVHPKFGDSQAAAFERVGYKFVREATREELEGQRITPPPADAVNGDSEALKGIMARLNAVEEENRKLKAANAEKSEAPASPAPEATETKPDEEQAAPADETSSEDELRAQADEAKETELGQEAERKFQEKLPEEEAKAANGGKPPVQPAF